MKNIESYPPLKAVEMANKKLPEIWVAIEKTRMDMLSTSYPVWREDIYIPAWQVYENSHNYDINKKEKKIMIKWLGGVLESANVQKLYTKVEHNRDSMTTSALANNVWDDCRQECRFPGTVGN